MSVDPYTVFVCLPVLPRRGEFRPLTHNDRLEVRCDPEINLVAGRNRHKFTLNDETVALDFTLGTVSDCVSEHAALKFHLETRPSLIQVHWDGTEVQGICVVAMCSGLVHFNDGAACYPGKYPFREIENRMRAFPFGLKENRDARERASHALNIEPSQPKATEWALDGETVALDMRLVEVEFGPPWPSYSTFADAIAGAKAQPGQVKAKRDSLQIAGSVLEEGQFGQSSCLLRFSNGKHLLVEARQFQVDWTVAEGPAPTIQVVPRRRLRHSDSAQEWDFDPNEMISVITGSELKMLAVTGPTLLVYTRGNEIFWLSAYRERSTGANFLHVIFET